MRHDKKKRKKILQKQEGRSGAWRVAYAKAKVKPFSLVKRNKYINKYNILNRGADTKKKATPILAHFRDPDSGGGQTKKREKKSL